MALRSLAIDIAFNSETGKLLAVNSAVDEIRDNAIGAGDSVEDLGKTTDSVSQSMLSKLEGVGETMGSVGKKMSVGLTAPIMAVGTAAVHTVAKFDDSMAKVQAISSATEDEFKDLRSTAIELGSTTAWSASEAADAMSYLALAGFDTNEILAATPDMLSLASAAGMDLATTADIVSDTMSAFQMEATRAGEAADMFAAAQSKSNTSVGELGEAMKYAGSAANSAGMDLAQTSAVLGILADSGIKGSMAGTTFTAMLRDMKKNADEGAISVGDMSIKLYDAEGQMRDLGSIMTDVEDATAGMTTEMRDAAMASIFGEQAINGVNIMLATGSDRYRELEAAIYDSAGMAEIQAAIMEDTVGGAFRAMRSAIEGFMIVIGDELKPYIQSAALFIGTMVGKFGQLSDGVRRAIVVFGVIAAAIGPLLFVGSKIIAMFGPTIALFTKISAAVKGAGGAFALLSNPIGWVVGAIGLVVGALVLAYKKVDWFREGINSAWEWIKNSTATAFEWVKDIIATVMESISEFVGGILSRLTAFWDEHGEFILDIVQTVFEDIKGTIQMVMGIIQGVFEIAWPIISGVVQIAWGVIETVVKSAIDIVLGLISVGMSILQGDWQGAWNAIKGIVTDIWNNIESFFKSVDLFQIGKDILQGLIDGISSMAGAVWDKITEIGSGIADKFKSVLKIFSPSRLFEGFGIDTMLGYTIGFEDEADNANEAAERVAHGVSDSFESHVPYQYEAGSNQGDTISYNETNTNNNMPPITIQNEFNINGNIDEQEFMRMVERRFPEMAERFFAMLAMKRGGAH